MKECKSCARLVYEGWRFCADCGENLHLSPCPACGQALHADWSFCVHCGHRLEEAAGELLSRAWDGPEPECRVLHLTDLHMTESVETGLVESHGRHVAPIRARLRAILERERDRVDHIIVTGDFTDSGKDVEYKQLVAILRETGCAGKLTVIPGNHELVLGTTFTAADKQQQLSRLVFWCRDFLPAGAQPEGLFPFVRWLHDRTAFIGLDTTGEGRSLYTSSSGSVDAPQLERLKAILDEMPDDVRKIVGIHHSLYSENTQRGFFDSLIHRYFLHLDNADALKALLLEHKNVIVLHGHHHLEILHEEGPERGRLINLGAASSVLPDEATGELQYMLLELYDDAILSIKVPYEDDERGGIRPTGELVRRRFTLEPGPIPEHIRGILRRPRFRRGAQERRLLDRWRSSGALTPALRESLARPGFLRTAAEKLALRERGLSAQES